MNGKPLKSAIRQKRSPLDSILARTVFAVFPARTLALWALALMFGLSHSDGQMSSFIAEKLDIMAAAYNPPLYNALSRGLVVTGSG